MEYYVNVVIYNTFVIEADSVDEARDIVSNMDNVEILNDSDFNIKDVEVV